MTTFSRLQYSVAPIAALIVATSILSGQTDPKEEPIITLNAFEVSSDRDVGYTASSALAGGRIEAPLKETPSAVTIMTREFLDDIAATSFSSAAEWAPNAIPVGDTGGGAGGEHNVNMRGLGSSFPSRNYFRWYVSSDSYATERLEFARGPNAILFGDANPGGVNTTWSKQALFVPKSSLQLRADSWGGYRASLDVNQPIGDRLALRVNLLHDRLGGWRDYDDAQRDGRHFAATFRIARETQIRAEYEQGRYLRYAFAQSFTDQSSNWNRSTVYNGATTPSTTGTGIARLNGGAANDYLVWDPNVGQVVNWRGFYQSTGTGLTLLPEGRAITNFPALPSLEFSRQPPDAFIAAKYRTWTVYAEHRFTSSLIAQLAYNYQQQTRHGNVRNWNTHRIDVNTMRPSANGGLESNPNFGKVFSDVNTSVLDRPNRLGDLRLSLAHRFSHNWLRHSLSLVSGFRTDEYHPRDYRVGRVNNPASPNANNATNVLMVRQYWDSPRNPQMFDSLVSNGGDYRWVMIADDTERQELFYSQIASASSLFDGRLSLLLGYRFDDYHREAFGGIGANPDGTPIIGASGGPGTMDLTDLSLSNYSAGAVWFPVPWIGPYVNYSQGFNAPGYGDNRIDGSPILNSSNEGVDVGLKLELLEGKVAGSIGYYFTEQVDRPRAGDNLGDINLIWTDLSKPERTLTGYRDTESYKGHGLEIDLTANLTRNWRLMFNYARPETEQADIGIGLRTYYDANIAEWQAGATNPAIPNRAAIAQNILDIESTIQGYTQGRRLNNTPDYTANAYTTYSFREGMLKGFAIGGGANFRGRLVIGNRRSSPFEYVYSDPYVLVTSHVSYTHKIGGVRTRYQLNVSNLLNDRDVVFTNYTFNAGLGTEVPNAFRHQAPRRFMLTVTFDL
ncbi:MAG: TonB-dependent receptor [Opitutaceae bacterium]|nr:TonB-dependent receptor [Opitutaceae bacterium]